MVVAGGSNDATSIYTKEDEPLEDTHKDNHESTIDKDFLKQELSKQFKKIKKMTKEQEELKAMLDEQFVSFKEALPKFVDEAGMKKAFSDFKTELTKEYGEKSNEATI